MRYALLGAYDVIQDDRYLGFYLKPGIIKNSGNLQYVEYDIIRRFTTFVSTIRAFLNQR